MWKTRTTDNLTILQRTGYTTFKELAGDFYSEAATHLPFVLPIHNLWWAKKLNDINYGKRTFRMWDGFPGWADLLHPRVQLPLNVRSPVSSVHG